MPRRWQYAPVLESYVPDANAPHPRPLERPESMARPAWIAQASDAAREAVVARIQLAITHGLVRPTDPAHACALLERSISGDLEESIEWRRRQLALFSRVSTTLDEFLKALDAVMVDVAEVEGEPEYPDGRLVYGLMPTSELELDHEWAAEDPESRPVLPSRAMVQNVRYLIELNELQRELEEVCVLPALSAAEAAVWELLERWENPPDPRRLTFMAAVRMGQPTKMRFASQCLALGLRPVEAAMVEGIVNVNPKVAGNTWFDQPDNAVRLMNRAYERLFAACGISP